VEREGLGVVPGVQQFTSITTPRGGRPAPPKTGADAARGSNTTHNQLLIKIYPNRRLTWDALFVNFHKAYTTDKPENQYSKFS